MLTISAWPRRTGGLTGVGPARPPTMAKSRPRAASRPHPADPKARRREGHHRRMTISARCQVPLRHLGKSWFERNIRHATTSSALDRTMRAERSILLGRTDENPSDACPDEEGFELDHRADVAAVAGEIRGHPAPGVVRRSESARPRFSLSGARAGHLVRNARSVALKRAAEDQVEGDGCPAAAGQSARRRVRTPSSRARYVSSRAPCARSRARARARGARGRTATNAKRYTPPPPPAGPLLIA